MIERRFNFVLFLLLAATCVCGLVKAAVSEEVSQWHYGGYNAFARGCMLNINSRKSFDKDMKIRGLHEITQYELEPKSEVLKNAMKVAGNSVSAWSDTKGSFTSLWAKVSVFDGTKWRSANMCFVHSNGNGLSDMMQWSSLFRNLATQDKPLERCCFDLPSYSSRLTVFEDRSPVKKIIDNIPQYEWTRYTVIFADSFNKQFQPLK
jgi:hypothetical protein